MQSKDSIIMVAEKSKALLEFIGFIGLKAWKIREKKKQEQLLCVLTLLLLLLFRFLTKS
ncbi:MAG: hypothetical protein ACOCWO_03780 [Candidatus Muiribacteriaceae bacterium]